MMIKHAALAAVGILALIADAAPAPALAQHSNQAGQTHRALRPGTLVRLRSGSPVMTVKSVAGDAVTVEWADELGIPRVASYPVEVLVDLDGIGGYYIER